MFRGRENTLTESGSNAEVACRQTLAKAGYAFAQTPASFHWSQLVNPRGNKSSAIDAYENLLALEPENKSALEGLAYLYQISGWHQRAQEYRRKLYEVEARQLGIEEQTLTDVVDYLLAKTGEAHLPDRVPPAFMQCHFDQYAETFDEHLITHLQYRAPQIITSLLLKLKSTLAADKVLDIGCGTGLVGECLQSQVARIDGVDISAKMLEKAKARNIYSQLIQADFINPCISLENDYTLAIASDVLTYQGDLLPFLESVKNRLAEKGYFVFTVEKSESHNFRLRNTGRFQHSMNYLNDLARQCQFDVVHEQEVVLRKEQEQPVVSVLYCFTN